LTLRFNIRQKMAIVIVLFTIPIALLGALFIRQSMKDIAFSALERDGVVYLEGLIPSYLGLLRASSGLESGFDITKEAAVVEALGKRFDASMVSKAANENYLSALRSLSQGLKPDAASPLALQASAEAKSLIVAIGDGSNLILDPDLDSYYLMDVVINHLPEFAETVRDLSRVTAKAQAQQKEGVLSSLEVVGAVQRASDKADAIRSALGRALAAHGGTLGQQTYAADVARFEDRLARFAAAIKPLGRQAAEEILDRKAFEAMNIAVADGFSLLPDFWVQTSKALDALLVKRIDGFWMQFLLGAFISVVLFLAALALAIALIRSVGQSISRLSSAISDAASGDVSVPTPFLNDRTEIGGIARAVDALRKATVNHLMEEHAKSREAAVLAKAQEASSSVAEELRATIVDAIEAINGLASAMGSATDKLSMDTEQGFMEMSSASERLASTTMSLTAVSGTITEFSASIGDIAEQAARHAAVTTEASQGSQMVSLNVTDLIEATARIGSMVETIAGIASQTNLLALNATIEAARAGEAGRGFAVVAAEVKSLAQTTASAAGEITQQIGAIESLANSFGSAVRTINDTILTLSDISSAIASAISQQRSASGELDKTVHSVAKDAEDVSISVRSVLGLSRSAGEQASEMGALSHDLSDCAAMLQDKADALIRRLQAA
jgi:methyl-accepting chemotaxis protein